MDAPATPIASTLFYHVKQKLGISWDEYLLLDYIYQRQLMEAPVIPSVPLVELAQIFNLSTSRVAQSLNKLIGKNLLQAEGAQQYLIGRSYYTEVYS